MKSIGLIPAAGLGTRLNLDFPKELLSINNYALIDYSINNLLQVGITNICIVLRKDKKIIKAYVELKYSDIKFYFAYQEEPYGNLIDSIKCSINIIKNKEVHFALADTRVYPSPYKKLKNTDLVIYCFKTTKDEWSNFGCFDRNKKIIIDKPKKYIGNLCWGALSWSPKFRLNSKFGGLNYYFFLSLTK